MNLEQKNFCFCTYTSGSTYRALTKLLVEDLAKYAPGIPFIIFTDQPNDFQGYENVWVYKHNRKGIKAHNERRFAIEKALSLFNSCLYLDGDVRICAPIPQEFITKKWLPGITARSCGDLVQHIQSRMMIDGKLRPKVVQKMELVKTLATRLGLNLEKQPVPFINEFLFIVTRDSGKENEFLKLWGKLSYYVELNGFTSPTLSMGLAATKLKFPVRHDKLEGLDFFDDRIETVRIANGQSDLQAKKEYFEAMRNIEQKPLSTWEKINKKLMSKIEYYWNYSRVKTGVLFDESYQSLQSLNLLKNKDGNEIKTNLLMGSKPQEPSSP